MKRFLSIALVLTLLLSFSVPALAAGNQGCNTGYDQAAILEYLLGLLKNRYNGNASNNTTCPTPKPAAPCVTAKPEATPTQPEAPEQTETPSPGEPTEAPATPAPLTQEEAYALEVVRLVNEERAKEGLKALTADAGVMAAAQMRAAEIQSVFSHSRPDGKSCFTALDEQNVAYYGAGENIAAGQKTPEAVMKSWMNSSGHRANILNTSFTNIGVGCYKDGSGRLHWTQLFTY
ncbi:CAP domain-containing protein [Christensenellaceae bacterium OttesenSCG-928-M15]|nr:CAP domain-containing protein [Christensenellaceae bacterium OttesenSCG-928-M15]